MLEKTLSTGTSVAVSCLATEVIGKDNYVMVASGIGALIGGAFGYALCEIPSDLNNLPNPITCGAAGALLVGVLSAGGSYITGSACEVANPIVKEKLGIE